MHEFFKKYIFRHFDVYSLFPPIKEADKALDFNSFQLSASRKIWLFIVSISHWICVAGFALAVIAGAIFHWNPVDWQVPFSERTFDPLDMLKMLCVSGLIGYGTNYIAIHMLFRPVHKRPIWGQGLIPAQRERIIYTLASGLHKHVLHQDIILLNLHKAQFPERIANLIVNGTSNMIKDKAIKDEIRNWIVTGMSDYFGQEKIKQEILLTIDEKVNQNLEGGIKKFLVSAYKKYNTEDYVTFIEKMMHEVPPTAGKIMDKFGDEKTDEVLAYISSKQAELADFIAFSMAELLQRIDITGLLRAQMAHFDDAKLEKMIWEASNEQLLYIQYLGTILGILGGLVIWEPIFMISVYSILLGVLMLIDRFLFHVQQKKA